MAKKSMSTKKALAIFSPCITLVLVIMLALIIAASMFYEDISLFLYGRTQEANAAALASGEALCEDIVEEGAVLLKNGTDEDGEPALPLSADELEKVNVFGWAAYDWMTMAFGSGYANTDLQKIKFFPALEEAGIGYNQDLYNLYKDYYTAHSKTYGDQDYLEYRGGVSFGSEEIFVLREPSKAQYMALKDSIQSYSSVGLVVIGRTGSESKDLELRQVKQKNAGSNEKVTVTDRHYLELSTEEEDMISVATELCEKVIVILNTANTMETGFLDNDKIDGALLVGITGLTGVRGLVNVLRGYKDEPIPVLDSEGEPTYDDNGPVYEKNADGSVKTERVKVSPSGRTADTYAYDILGTTPSAVAQGDKGAGEAGAGTVYLNCKSEDSRYRAYVDYSEGIYIGYKWFETADAEGFWDGMQNEHGSGYDAVVQWPFGYGLSYADFSWTVNDIKVGGVSKKEGTLGKDDTLVFTVEVKNVSGEGGYPGADVVELYYSAPYIEGGIEKASVVLGAFAKTKALAPGESETVTLELRVQDMASYDCYDKNENGHTGYELDAGEYHIMLMKNSHEIKSSSTEFTYTMSETLYDKDPDTSADVENRFTNSNGQGNDETIDEADLDGSHEETPVKYLSRADFKGTYPKKITTPRNRTAEAAQICKQIEPTQKQLEYAGYAGATRQKQTNGLKFDDVLTVDDYDDEIWDTLIANITDEELINLVQDGYFKTAAIESIGKVQYVDLDGPLGFNTRVTGGDGTTCMFMAYPSGTMLAQTWSERLAYALGLSVGRERQSMTGLRGWYAPGANLHRNPFGGRNGEYYSEDGLLSGYMCAETVRGAKDMGVYSYVKHFVANDSEYNREGLFTFLTEQTLRETYLRPFEIMIKEGGGNALMTAMNRLGRVWSGANYGLVTEIVRGEWGFHGTIVTDWMNSNESYMTPYRGIWAGNDIWLTNGVTAPAFATLKNETAYVIAEHVAHDVLWTLVDTFNAEKAYDPTVSIDTTAGAEYNMTWVWYIVLVEVVLAAGVGVMGYFLGRTIVRNKKAKAAEKEGEENEDQEN